MGRILEALKRPQPPASAVPVQPSLHASWPPSPGPSEGEDEVPYIEVGPHKSLDASPSVLASSPPAAVTGPRLVVPEVEGQTEVVEEEAPMPRKLHNVTFRPAEAAPAARLDTRPGFAPELIAYHQPTHAASVQYGRL